MATEPREMEDMTRIAGALLINIGTMRSENVEGMVLAGVHCQKSVSHRTDAIHRYLRQQIPQTYCFRSGRNGCEHV